MNRSRITKSANNIKDVHMRFVFQQFAKSLIELETQLITIQEHVNKPLDLKVIEDWINSQIAQNTVTLNQMINQKLNDFNNTIWKYVAMFNQSKPQDNIDINKQVIDIMSLVNKIEERLLKLEMTTIISENKQTMSDVDLISIKKPKNQPNKVIKKKISTKSKLTKKK